MISKEEKLARMAVIREVISDRNIAEVARRLKYTRVWLSEIVKKPKENIVPRLPSERAIVQLEDYLGIKMADKD